MALILSPRILYPLGAILLFPVLYFGGKWFGKRKKYLVVPVMLVLIMVLLISMFPMQYPAWSYPFLPWPGFYAYVQVFVPISAALFVISSGMVQLENERKKYVLQLFCAFLCFAALARAGFYGLTNYDQLRNHPPGKSIYTQSTDWSCGPAAGAMFLQQLGIRASEKQLSLMSPANRFTGTGPYQLRNGLQTAIGGQNNSVRILSPAPEELFQLKPPIIMMIRLNALINHWVVITKITGKNILVKNPLYKRIQEYSRRSLLHEWEGIVLVAEQR